MINWLLDAPSFAETTLTPSYKSAILLIRRGWAAFFIKALFKTKTEMKDEASGLIE
jgi:hypothetical protein